MANSNYREYVKGDVVRLKKYLYAMRLLLACQWILTTVARRPCFLLN